MARPKQKYPTPAEFEVLTVLWERGPSTVREVLEILGTQSRQRAYTSVMSLLNVMTEKGLLVRKPLGRAFVYAAKTPRDRTLGDMLGDLCRRAFGGSASAVVTHLLDQANPTPEELAEIRRTLEAYQQKGAE